VKFVAKHKEREDGRIVQRITVNGKKKDIYGRTPTELKNKVEEAMKLARLEVDISDKQTVDEWSDKWFKEYKSDVRHNTLQMYVSIYSSHIFPAIGKMQLKAVRQIDIKKILNEASTWQFTNKSGEVVKDGTTSESHLKKILLTLNQFFQAAVDNHLIISNPCVSVKIKKQQREKKIRTLNKEQQSQILSKSKLTRAYLFVGLGLYCGLRREESLALMWSDVDWENRRVKIQRTNTGRIEPLTKSSAGFRSLPIPPPLLAMLEDANPKHDSTGITKVRVRSKGEWIIREVVSEFVCPAATGSEMSLTSYTRMWEVVTKRVTFKVTSHMFRHTFCTALNKAGIDLRMAQYLMGDSDLKTVSQVYTSIENDQIASADEKMQNVFSIDEVINDDEEKILS
jgi:integrase